MVLARAGHEVVDAVVVHVAHGHAQGSLEAGEGRDRGDELVAVAVIDLHFCRMTLRSGNGHRISRNGRYDIHQHHQPVVLMVEAMAMHHEQAGEIVELHAQAKRALLDDGSPPDQGSAQARWRCRRPTFRARSRDPWSDRDNAMTWKSLTWMWIGCSSLLLLRNFHSSTEPSRGWSRGTLGNSMPSNT